MEHEIYGYHGKILVVNLTDRSFSIEEPGEDIYRQYFGGYGLGVYYIYRHLQPNCDPLGPQNILGILPGLLTGSPAPMTGRFIACGKSPLTGRGKRSNGKIGTGGWGNANSGGKFGPAIRRAGFDGIFFHGQAENPVYLFIDNGKVEIKEAQDLWGQDAVQTEKILKDRHGRRYEIASIGSAGEHQSLISGIVTDQGRIAARSGLGAVMGSKQLKAICLGGKQRVKFADQKIVINLAKEYNNTIKKYTGSKLLNNSLFMMDKMAPMMRVLGIGVGGANALMARITTATFGGAQQGTTAVNVLSSQNGDAPVKNFKGIGYKDFPMAKAMNLRGKRLKDYMKKQYGCFSCPVKCGAILEYEDLPYADKETHRPEYETCMSFGAMLLNDDMDTLLKVNEYLNRAGMDTISAGDTVAFTVECVEHGLLTRDDFKCESYPEGFKPQWGDASFVLPLVKMMVHREGIGNLLADGTKVASEHIEGSDAFAIHSNGQELPMHDPRLDPALGLTYLTDPTPGRHTAGTIDFEGGMGMDYFIKEIDFENSKDPLEKARLSSKVVKFHQTLEALGFCIFSTYFGQYPYLEMLKAVFNWDISAEEVLATGHRIQTLRQMFNAREGAIRHEFPQRALGNPPFDKGPLKKVSLDLEVMAQAYYEAMGYSKTGIPLESTLHDLDLTFTLDDLNIATGVPDPLVNTHLETTDENPNFGKNIKPLRGG